MQSKQSSALCLANFFVIALIPLLFFLAMILGYLNIIPLNVPVHSLGIIGFIFFVFLLFTRHNANYSICKMRSSRMQLQRELHKELDNTSLEIQTQKKSVLDIQKFLNGYYIDIRNDNFVSVASSIFPMLGILGTFVAIALSMPDFSVTDTEALDREISLLLSGVGSAFFASIYGILLSLIWTYFEKRGLSKIAKYFSEIESQFQVDLWTKEELLIYKYRQNELKENRFIEALKETFNLDFIEKISAQHLDNFNTLTQNLQTTSAELRSSLAKMQVGSEAIEAQNSIKHSISEFTDATHSFEKTTKVFSAQLNNSLNRTFEKIDAEVGEIVIKLADFATHVSSESREVQESISKYHAMVAANAKIKLD